MADFYVHTGMIGLDGTKMSKSLGNLVFVHKLVEAGHDPSAIRLGVFAGHYRTERDWSDGVLTDAADRLTNWREALNHPGSRELADALVATLREHLAADLDTPGALAAVDEWASASRGSDEETAGELVCAALNSLLGVRV